MSEFVEMTPANIWFGVAVIGVFVTIFVLGYFMKHDLLVKDIATLIVGILWWKLVQYEVITLTSLGAVLLIFLGGSGISREIARKRANPQD